MGQLLQIDYFISDFLKHLIPHNNLSVSFFSFFSLIGFAAFVWVVIGLLLIAFRAKEQHKFIFYYGMTLAVSYISFNIIKIIVRRPRPFIEDATNLKMMAIRLCPKDFSFPSGHATVAFASATVLAAFDKKRSWFYFLVALVISYSRIFLECHFFLDVLFGAFLGTAIAKLVLQINVKKWIHTKSRK